MALEDIERNFCLYLDEFWQLDEIKPFILIYTDLLLLFKDELSKEELYVVTERQKEFRGEKFEGSNFEKLKKCSQNKLEGYTLINVGPTKEEMLSKLLFCALLDTSENDCFYLTEPIFEFAHGMQVSPDQLIKILKSEFPKFKI